MDTQSLAFVKSHFSECVERVASQQDQVTITKNGKPAAVLISYEEYQRMDATLDALSGPVDTRALLDAIEEIDRGEGVPLDVIRADIAARVAARE